MKTLLKPLFAALGIASLVPALALAQPSPDEKTAVAARWNHPNTSDILKPA